MTGVQRLLLAASLAASACGSSDDPAPAGADGGPGRRDAAPPGDVDGGGPPDGGGVPDGGAPPRADAGGGPSGSDDLFLTAPPPPACSPGVAASWEPIGGFSGGISGIGACGTSSPCPDSYVAGNSGAACSSGTDCDGLDPVCLHGAKYPGGTCAATGCELGSNFGCPERAVCIAGGDGETYCIAGCGIDQTGCFVHCGRDGYACFTTESKSLGMCLGVEGVRQCDPSASNECTRPEFGDGVCVQTSWDDQTVGRCFETCDPIVQDCVRDGEGCYVLREYPGFPVCFQSWGFPEGTRCSRLTQCDEGLRCSCDSPDQDDCRSGAAHMYCRWYCPTDGSVACPAGTACRPIWSGSRWGSCQP